MENDIKKNSKKIPVIGLFDAMSMIEGPENMENFMRDLCTPQELSSFKERWVTCQLLKQGGLSYREISKAVKTSSATIVRVARFLYEENYHGYRYLLNKIEKKFTDTENISKI